MIRRVTNVGASVRQRLLNEAKRRGETFEYVASLYARERFLARLSVSPDRSRLILKGATVMALWVDAHRTTRDLDFLGSGSFAPENAASLVRAIVSESVVDDGLIFDAASVTAEAIREADEYGGVRVHVDARLDSARIRLQIDIAVGDVVTPPARTAVLPAMLPDFPAAKVKVYPPETIIAEKLHAGARSRAARRRSFSIRSRSRRTSTATLTNKHNGVHSSARAGSTRRPTSAKSVTHCAHSLRLF